MKISYIITEQEIIDKLEAYNIKQLENLIDCDSNGGNDFKKKFAINLLKLRDRKFSFSDFIDNMLVNLIDFQHGDYPLLVKQYSHILFPYLVDTMMMYRVKAEDVTITIVPWMDNSPHVRQLIVKGNEFFV